MAKLKRASTKGPDGGALAWKQWTNVAMPEQPFDWGIHRGNRRILGLNQSVQMDPRAAVDSL